MAATFLDEQQYFNLVAGIAILNDCRLLNINFPNREINLSGTPEAVQACSCELEKILGKYQAE